MIGLLELTRGERNNNLGNLDYIVNPAVAWNGQIGIEIVPPGETYTPRFGRYDTMFHGLRAMGRQLIVDNTRHGLLTLSAIIGDPIWGWAPAADRNDPDSYVKTVATIAGIDPDAPIDLTDTATLLSVLPGFIIEENGRCPCDHADLLAACQAATAAV